jgi:hypothetical protein
MNRGFILILATVLILAAGLIIILSGSYISLNNIKAARNNIYSARAYYVAEAGIEDSLLRLRRGMNFSKSNNLTIDNGTATIEISDPIGGSRTITSKGDISNRTRKLSTVYTITTDHVSFHYGAQVGEGGIIMENNSRIRGNVFSNGSISATGGKGYIDYTVKVATIGSKIEGLDIGEDAYTHNCKNCVILGTLYYSGGGQENCTASGGVKEHPVQEIEDLPVSDEQINEWKQDALDGGTFLSDYIVLGGTVDYLGPKKIEGNLVLENNATLIIAGTLWVVGNIVLNNESIIELSEAYGGTSGIIIADGRINIENGADIQGSGQEGSYTMFVSTNFSLDFANPAIDVKNNATGAIFYASNGLIRLRNNMEVREITGYQIYLDNNAIVEYEIGLEDTAFSSGPGGSWEISEWREIE